MNLFKIGSSSKMHQLTRASRAILLTLAATATLAGCSDVRGALGYQKQAPDEFRVVARAPLSMPPEYSLRPPEPGAPRPQEASPRDAARSLLVGQGGNGRPVFDPSRTPGENAMLNQSGAVNVDPSIRDVVNRETASLAEADKTLTDRLVFWRDPAPFGTILDAQAETKRLQENQALGRSVTEGETPVIERKQRGLLEGIF